MNTVLQTTTSMSTVERPTLRPPPLLLGAALLFWGWQADFLLPGAVMALILEAARWLKVRWDLSDDDFARIWTFCTLLFLAAAVVAFTSNEGPADFRSFFQNPNFMTERNAGTATTRTAVALVRWLPMLFFLFVAAQAYSSREAVPLEVVSLILRRRWKRARLAGRPLPPARPVNVAYFFFALCLFAASVHASEDRSYFWGLCVLLAWALWSRRSRRFSLVTWAAIFALAVGLAYLGQGGLGRIQTYLSNLNPQWLASLTRRRFDPTQSRTELGRLGGMKASGTIVIRLEAKDGPVPQLLREASYRTFKGISWYSETPEKEFDRIQEEPPNSGTWVLLPGKTNLDRVQIACYLDGGKALLPLPPGAGRLENLTAYELWKSTLGALLAQGPGLVVFDALYGPGNTIDGPANTNEDLLVPPREIPALDQVIAQLGLQQQTPEQAVKTLNSWFQRQFTYSVYERGENARPGRRGAVDSPLTRFLLKTHRGHCEYFATAGVLVLRRLGIPTRYAVGYAIHEGTGGKYIARQRDAHAWCLVWNEKHRLWRDIDFTPSVWVQEEGLRASRFQSLGDFFSNLRFQFSKFRWGQTHLRRYLLLAVIPVLIVLLIQIIWRSRRRSARSTRAKPSSWPGLDSEFYSLERRLAKRGFVRGASEPVSEWLQRTVDHPSMHELRGPLQGLIALHYRYRFDPHGLTPSEREELRAQARDCLVEIERAPVAPQ